MTEVQSSYRKIFRATSLFGGVQVLNIFIGIIRTKFVAVLLGATGVGIFGLLNSPLNLIMSITGLGIAFSAVRDISVANSEENQIQLAKTIKMVRRWASFTGLFGSIVTILLSPLLSKWTFGNLEYTWAFIWLSITLLLQSISKSQTSILQGTRRLKDMAKASVIGSFIGLLTSVPLYYFLGIKGIVPAMIITAATALCLTWYFSRKIFLKEVDLTYTETYNSGLGMVRLGIYMTIAGFVSALSTYIINAFINHYGGIAQVGLYNAGWGVVGQYTGIVFSAMATDYFPRLSAIQDDNDKLKELVRQQGETALLIMNPLLSLLIIAMPLVVKILYTQEFFPVIMFANLTVIGMQLKVISWAMGYVYLAKGNGKLFLFIEVISGSLILLMNLLFYRLYGLNGLGISSILSYLLGAILSYIILNLKYNFSFPSKFMKGLIVTYIFILSAFATSLITSVLYRYLAGIIVLIFATIFSFARLNDLMDLRSYILEKINKQN